MALAPGSPGDGATGREGRGRSWLRVPRSRVVAPVLTFIGLLAVWELAVRILAIPEYLLPAPSVVFAYTVDHLDLLLPHAQATLYETVAGFLMSVAFGIVFSMLIVWSRTFEESVYPLVVMTQVIPKVAIAPLLIIYLGFGLTPKLFLAFLISFFPMVINTTLGMKSVNPELLELLATLHATRWQVMYKVRFRRAIPYMVEGAKIAITLAVIGAIVGEFTAGSEGLGYLILASTASFDTVQGFSSLFIITILGIALFEAVHIGGRYLLPPPERGRM